MIFLSMWVREPVLAATKSAKMSLTASMRNLFGAATN